MSISEERKRSDNKYDFLVCCDDPAHIYCKTHLDEKDKLWGQMITSIKARGWTIRKVHGIWLHICPDCKPFAPKSSFDVQSSPRTSASGPRSESTPEVDEILDATLRRRGDY